MIRALLLLSMELPLPARASLPVSDEVPSGIVSPEPEHPSVLDHEGILFGSARSLRRPPAPDCERRPAPGFRWACPDVAYGVPVTVLYRVDGRRWPGVVLLARVDRQDATRVLSRLLFSLGPEAGISDDGDLLWRRDDLFALLHLEPADDDRLSIRLVLMEPSGPGTRALEAEAQDALVAP